MKAKMNAAGLVLLFLLVLPAPVAAYIPAGWSAITTDNASVWRGERSSAATGYTETPDPTFLLDAYNRTLSGWLAFSGQPFLEKDDYQKLAFLRPSDLTGKGFIKQIVLADPLNFTANDTQVVYWRDEPNTANRWFRQRWEFYGANRSIRAIFEWPFRDGTRRSEFYGTTFTGSFDFIEFTSEFYYYEQYGYNGPRFTVRCYGWNGSESSNVPPQELAFWTFYQSRYNCYLRDQDPWIPRDIGPYATTSFIAKCTAAGGSEAPLRGYRLLRLQATGRVIRQPSSRFSGRTDLAEILTGGSAARSSSYWSYPVLTSTRGADVSLTAGNWTVDFISLQASWESRQFYYSNNRFRGEDWGNWGAFNYFRDIFAAALSGISLFISFVLYLTVAAASLVGSLILSSLLLLLVNLAARYLLWGILFIGWFLWLAILTLYDWILKIREFLYAALRYFWEEILLPFLQFLLQKVKEGVEKLLTWAREVLLPLVLNALNTILSAVAATILYLLSLARADWWGLFDAIFGLNEAIAAIFLNLLYDFQQNILIFALYASQYLLLIALGYVKVLYCRFKGYLRRAERLQASLKIFLLPLEFLRALARWLKDILSPLS